MQAFEETLKQAIDPVTGNLLAGIGVVADADGNILYRHAAGKQDINPDSPPVNPNSTISWTASAKFIPNMAALQLVQRGLVDLDEPMSKHIPELDKLPLVARKPGSNPQFIVTKPKTPITLRHLLCHTAGVDTRENPLVKEYLEKHPIHVPDDAYNLVKMFSMPLVHEPGEGFLYGTCVYWVQLLVQILGGGNFQTYVDENILRPLGMTTATYVPAKVPEVYNQRLRAVEKMDGSLVAVDEHTYGFTCSIDDMVKLLQEFITPTSKLLKPEYRDMLIQGQLKTGSPALEQLQGLPENYEFIGDAADSPKFNVTAGGTMVTNADVTKSGLPAGTVCWEGILGTTWAVNKDKGTMAIFATQALPYEAGQDVILAFMRDVWKTST